MKIRNDQMGSMDAARQAEYDRGLLRYFRSEHAGITGQYSDAELLNMISVARRRAASYGIRSGDGTKKFVIMAVLISPTFDEHPDVKRYLKQPDLDPDYKIIALSEQVARNIREKID